MSCSHKETIACSHCHSQQQFTIWESVNVSIDPEQKQQLINGELTTFLCVQCGSEAHIEYDCLYHDMDKSLAIWLKYPEQDKLAEIDPATRIMASSLFKNYTCRIVTSFHEFIDKISIFDDGFSDYAVEFFKLLICMRKGIDICCPFHYAGLKSSIVKGKSLLFALETEQGFVEYSYRLQQFENVTESFMPKITTVIDKLSDEWPKVDRTYMLRVLELSGLMRNIR